MIEYLPWDSQFFKLKIGKVVLPAISTEDIDVIIKLKKADNYDIIYLFTISIKEQAADIIYSHGGQLVDQKVTFLKSDIKNTSLPENILPFRGNIKNDLLELVYLSGHDSRFKKDQRLNAYFEKLYFQWIEKSVSGELADIIYVYEESESIKGFVTIQDKKEYGQVGLIAVSPDMQGKGVGAKLMEAADHWYHKNEINTAKVITQITNFGACKLYKKMGYIIKTVEFIYHL